MSDVTFYRELHYKEFERQEMLAGRSSGLIAVLTTLSGLLAYLLTTFKPSAMLATGLFWGTATVAAGALVAAATFLIRSYDFEPLTDIDGPDSWRTFYAGLVASYAKAAGTFATADAEFQDHLVSVYAGATEHNIRENTKRGARLVQCNQAMLFAFVFLAIAAVAFYYSSSSATLQNDRRLAGVLAMPSAVICVPVAEATQEPGPKPGTRPVPTPKPPKE